VLNFKKPSRVIIIAAVALALVLSIGFAVNGISSGNEKHWELYTFPYFNYHDPDNTFNIDVKVNFHTDEGTYPPSVQVIRAELWNEAIPGELTCGSYFTLVKQVGGDWRVVPFKEGIGFDSIAILLSIGQSEIYTVTKDMFDADLAPGNYRIVTDVWFQGERVPYLSSDSEPAGSESTFYNMEKLTVWANFLISESEAGTPTLAPRAEPPNITVKTEDMEANRNDAVTTVRDDEAMVTGGVAATTARVDMETTSGDAVTTVRDDVTTTMEEATPSGVANLVERNDVPTPSVWDSTYRVPTPSVWDSTYSVPTPSVWVAIEDSLIGEIPGEEFICEDAHYRYSLTSTRSERIMLTFEDGQQFLLKDALSQKRINIEDLILNGLQVIIEPKVNPMGGSFNYYPYGKWSLNEHILFPSNRFMYTVGMTAYFAFDELIEFIEMCGYKEQADRVREAYSVWSYRYVIEGIEYVEDIHLETLGIKAHIGWFISSNRAPVVFSLSNSK